jgi:hypothetical protein
MELVQIQPQYPAEFTSTLSWFRFSNSQLWFGLPLNVNTDVKPLCPIVLHVQYDVMFAEGKILSTAIAPIDLHDLIDSVKMLKLVTFDNQSFNDALIRAIDDAVSFLQQLGSHNHDQQKPVTSIQIVKGSHNNV